MSWGLAGDWLAVAGLGLLTFGTGAQAWASRADFKAVGGNLKTIAAAVFHSGKSAHDTWLDRAIGLEVSFEVMIKFLFGQLHGGAEDDMSGLKRLYRLTVVWSILMVGSALILAAACIQLALA